MHKRVFTLFGFINYIKIVYLTSRVEETGAECVPSIFDARATHVIIPNETPEKEIKWLLKKNPNLKPVTESEFESQSKEFLKIRNKK